MKERITITVDDKLLKWIDGQISEKVFANRSHALAFLVKSEMQAGQRKGKDGGGR